MGWQKLTLESAYDIDLTLPEDRRWDEVIAKELPAAKKLVEEARADFDNVPYYNTVLWPFRKALGWWYRRWGAYAGELGSWADALGMSYEDYVLLQFSYELSHAAEWYAYKRGDVASVTPFGCTAGIHYKKGQGMVHIRNMDWPLTQLGQATRIFRFHTGRHEFIAVGILGKIGIISGMVPGNYSVTMNWAPPTGYPSLGLPLSYVLREGLQNNQQFENGLRWLRNHPLPTNGMFAVCGVKPHEAEVVERLRDQYAVRNRRRASPLCVANHFESSPLINMNGVIEADQEILDYSKQRRDTLEKVLSAKSEADDIESWQYYLDEDPVLNDGTCQQMVFHPKTGYVQAYGLHT